MILLSHMQRILVLSALLVAPTAVLAQAAPDGLLKGATLVAPTGERNAMASGAVEEGG